MRQHSDQHTQFPCNLLTQPQKPTNKKQPQNHLGAKFFVRLGLHWVPTPLAAPLSPQPNKNMNNTGHCLDYPNAQTCFANHTRDEVFRNKKDDSAFGHAIRRPTYFSAAPERDAQHPNFLQRGRQRLAPSPPRSHLCPKLRLCSCPDLLPSPPNIGEGNKQQVPPIQVRRQRWRI